MKILFSFCLCLLLSSCATAQTTVTVKGKIIGRDSKTMFIIPRTVSDRSKDKPIIKILNNEFSYTFTPKNIEAYEIVFEDEYNQGAWRPVVFFPDTSIVEMQLFDMDNADKNSIKGGTVNRNYFAYMAMEKNRYQAIRDRLLKQTKLLDADGNYRSKEHAQLMESLRKAKDHAEKLPLYQQREELQKMGKDLTPDGLKIRASYDSLNKDLTKWKYAYIKQNPSISNYFLLFNDAQYLAKNNRDLAMYIDEAYKQYAVTFPDHWYTKVVGDAIAGIVKLFPGNQFVDFSAPDLKGQTFTLSEQIKGKVALIDLWGSWCGPCIAKAQLVVPIYKKYKDKGFTVVGIAREFKNTDALKSRLKKEEFNWLNLVELDDKAGIWNKYAISNGAGIQVLVDASGKILAVEPTAEEVEKLIKKKMDD
ncbi:MAG: TlpA family protein disulfide reductase [Chitinophagaceae bacterium]|nr:MAG: TlpA family protein disulfide reductase [Chitinophagaceae bacterium]